MIHGVTMDRREFLYGLGGALLATPGARAQQRPPLIGLLSSTSAEPYKPLVDAFTSGLRERGFVEGRNLAIEHRWVDGNYERLAGLAKDLVALRANVIVAVAPPAARAAKAATASIPIVFSTSGDPIALGLVSSLNRPGENLTGVNLMLFAMGPKRLDLLVKLVPNAERIGLLVNPNNPSTARSRTDSQTAARALGKTLIVVSAGNEREIEAAFDSLREQKVTALSVEADPYLLARRDQLAARAARDRLPVIYPHRENAEAGGLISYGTDLSDAYRQIGIYTARVLIGEQPGNLPVMQITKFETVINMKAARAIDLTIPPDLLTLADQLIE
jgi:putative ABC transport system substrate-binding protein